MKKQLFTLSLVAALSLSAAACMNSATDLPPGHYEGEKVSKDSAGTKTVNKTETDVGVDAYGKKTAVVKNKKSTDPKGLFNKSTNTSTTVEEER